MGGTLAVLSIIAAVILWQRNDAAQDALQKVQDAITEAEREARENEDDARRLDDADLIDSISQH